MIRLPLPEAVPLQCRWGQCANKRVAHPAPSQRAGSGRCPAAPLLSARGHGTDPLQKPPQGRTPARSIAQLLRGQRRAQGTLQPPGKHRSPPPLGVQRSPAPNATGTRFLALPEPPAPRRGVRKGEAGVPLTFAGTGGSQVVDAS